MDVPETFLEIIPGALTLTFLLEVIKGNENKPVFQTSVKSDKKWNRLFGVESLLGSIGPFRMPCVNSPPMCTENA